MTIRMYKTKLFEEIRRDATTVTGYVLDSDRGERQGDVMTVPANEVTLTGDDQLCADIARMSESELLDFVLAHVDYLTDSYYRAFAAAITARHAELRGGVANHDDARA